MNQTAKMPVPRPVQGRDDMVEYRTEAFTSCSTMEHLVERFAQHRCKTRIILIGNEDDEPTPYLAVRTRRDDLGETSRRVEMVRMLNGHLHEHVNITDPGSPERVSVRMIEFRTATDTRVVVSIVLDHTGDSQGERERSAAARRAASSAPGARWLAPDRLSNKPEPVKHAMHDRKLEWIIGIVEDPGERNWTTAPGLKAIIERGAGQAIH